MHTTTVVVCLPITDRQTSFAFPMSGRDRALISPPTLLLGYEQMPEHAIRAGVRELAMAIRAARTRR